MTAKDLIEHFNSPSTLSSQDIPQPSSRYPARFLSFESSSIAMIGEKAVGSHRHMHGRPPLHSSEFERSLDITDPDGQIPNSTTDGLPMRSNLPQTFGRDSHESDGDKYPLLTQLNSTYELLEINSTSQRPSKTHNPIPSTVVFARNAPPLYLPELDKFLSSMPPPSFSSSGAVKMFPPMNNIASTGKTLDDLEFNSTIPPSWRNRKTLLGMIVSLVLGLTGSSALASMYSLQGLLNTVQVFALILDTIVPLDGANLGNDWKDIFLGTIPNILALNLASTLVESLIFLLIFMGIAGGLLYLFYRLSKQCDRYAVMEGLQPPPSMGTQWGLVLVTFLLTVIYLPLSAMAIRVLVWSQDLWVVPNPYTNATSFPPILPPLGPSDEYRDPLDFCWTTTMQKNQVNYAPIIIIMAGTVTIFLTVWFPITLRHVIKASLPKVDKFTELGRLRNSAELDVEYHRVLARDSNPFAFLYSGFRRGWGTYESTYLGAKFSTLFIVAIIDSNNCLFRSVSRSILPIVRQIMLVLCALGFFLAQCMLGPFLDPVNNASEWTSRLNYVLTSIVALLVTLNIPSANILNTYVLYTIYIVTYSLTFYFTVVNLGPVQRLLKRLTRRIDFSIDIFSPRLNLSSSSPHSRRRIWQESITTLILTTPDCAIPKKQIITYAQARDSEYPPYLLGFQGTPGERHVENLKIYREVGSEQYTRAAALRSGSTSDYIFQLEGKIQRHFTGPDCYWKSPRTPGAPGCRNYFGNAWWIPFPPTLVMRYDNGPTAILTELTDLETYIFQNSRPDIHRRQHVRLSLRALQGQVVAWPYDHVLPIGTKASWFGKTKYEASKCTHYNSCILNIDHHGHLVWDGLQIGSGFEVKLQYTKKVSVPGEVIGLDDDYDLTATLARFLELNRNLISKRLPYIEGTIERYRRHNEKVNRWKSQVLSYQFLPNVYNHPQDPAILATDILASERDPRVQCLVKSFEMELAPAYQRWFFVSRSETRTWWYIFWDDLWRRNSNSSPELTKHARDFNPYYPCSIAYTPLPRAALETFLGQRGLLSKTGIWTTLFTPGFLNKIYLRLNDTVFHSTSREIMFHIGDGSTEWDMREVDLETNLEQPSSIGTGAGTNLDDSIILPRPQYRWEGILTDPPYAGKTRRRWFSKLGAWMGWTPTWKSGSPSRGISLDVKLENGQFVLLDASHRNN